MSGFTWGGTDGATLGQSSGGKFAAYPKAPENLTVSATRDTEIDLSWDNVTGWDELRVYRAQSSGSTTGDYTQVDTLTTLTTTYTDTSLENGEQYYYRVEAVRAGVPELSGEASGTTTVPAPTSVSLDTTTEDQITVSWANNDNSTDGTIEILRSQDGSTGSSIASISDLSTTSYTDSSLEDGERYYYVVRRSTDHANGDSSQVDGITVLPAATSVSVSQRQAITELEITWTNNDDSLDGDIKVYRSQTNSDIGSQVAAISRSSTSYIDTGLQSGTTYYYTIRRETDHTSVDSAQASGTTSGIGDEKVTLKWESKGDWDNAQSFSGIAIGGHDGYNKETIRRGFPVTRSDFYAAYTFAANDGTLYDRVGGVDGSVVNTSSITFDQAGVNDTESWYFDGSNDSRVEFPRQNFFGNVALSYVVNVKPEDTSEYKMVVFMGGDDSREAFHLAINGNCTAITLHFQNTDSPVDFSTTDFQNTWAQIGATYNPSTNVFTVYRDGSSLGTYTAPGDMRINDVRFGIGSNTFSRPSYSGAVYRPMQGYISDAAIVDGTLSSSDMSSIYDSFGRGTMKTAKRKP